MKTLLFLLLLTAQRAGLEPAATAVVTGRLTGPNGPAAGIRVAATPAPEANAILSQAPVLVGLAETGADGRYRLEGIPAGRYLIVAGLLEFPTYYPGRRNPAEATVVNVTAGATVDSIDFQTARASTGLTVSGRVVRDGAQQQVGGPQVTLSGSDQHLSTITKADGSFEFLRVRPGNYLLNISTVGFEPRNLVLRDDDVTGLELIVPWTVNLNGNVDVEGGGLRPAISLLFSGGPKGQYAARGTGAMRTVVPEGVYAVTVGETPGGYYVKSVTSGPTDLLVNPLRVSRDAEPAPVVVTLGVSTPVPWVRLSGRVTGFRPSTTTSAPLSLALSTNQSAEAIVAPDGSFEFPMILPGIYSASFRNYSFPLPPVSVVVPNRDLAGLELSLPTLKEVAGRILVDDGSPLPRVVLTLEGAVSVRAPSSTPSLSELLLLSQPGSRSNTITLNLNTQPDGSFRTSLPEGRYRVSAAIPAYGPPAAHTLKSLTYGARDLLKDPIDVTATTTAELRVTVAPVSPGAWAAVSGRVTGLSTPTNTSGPVTVSLSSAAYPAPLTATVNADGSFAFPKVYSGSYTASLSTFNPESGQPTLPVTVSNTDVTGLVIVVPRQKQIAGRIVMEGGGPVPRLILQLGGSGRSAGVATNPMPDGSFTVSLNEGERPVSLGQLPAGYVLKSFTYGSVDLTKNPLKTLLTDTAELVITLSAPTLASVKVRGSVTGLDSSIDPARLRLSLANTNNEVVRQSLSAAVTTDATFEFGEVRPGSYRATLSGQGLVSAFNTTVVVRDTDTTLEIAAPGQRVIRGRVIVEGGGPLPRMSIGHTPVSGATTIRYMFINTQLDGSFTLTLPEEETRVNGPIRMPTAYTLKSFTLGSVDLLRDPLKISRTDTSEFTIIVAAPAQGTVSVSGRVDGFAADVLSRGAARVSLSDPTYVTNLTAVVRPDGSFEFPAVLPGDYSARLTAPTLVDLFASKSVTVADADIRNLQFDVPGQRTLSGRIVVEGDAPLPRLSLRVMSRNDKGLLTGRTLALAAQPDGTFRLTLPEGEHQVDVPSLPEGYRVKSLTYGTASLIGSPLKFSATDAPEELRIALEVTSSLVLVSVSGRVTGPTPITRVARVMLTATGLALESTVNENGEFTFSRLFPGNYSLRLTSVVGASPPPAARTIVVGKAGITGLEIPYPHPHVVNGRVLVDGVADASIPPLVGMEVRRANGQIASSTIAAGTFNLTMDTEEQTVAVRSVPDGYVLQSLTFGTVDLLKTPLKLDAPPETDIIVKLTSTPKPPPFKGVRLRGRVTGDLPSVPVPREVLVSGPGPADLRISALGKDGKFELQSLPPGTYTLRVAGVPAALTPPKEIAVLNKDVNGVEIPIPVQFEVTGQVIVEGGGPLPALPGLIVDIQRAGSAYAGVVREDGSFALVLAEGEQRFSIRGIPQGYILKSIRYGSRDVTNKPVKATRKDAASGIQITLGVR